MIEIEVRHDHALIRLNSPPVNALDTEDFLGLLAAVDALTVNRDVRFAVLTGTGRCFCAGVNLQGLEGIGAADFESFTRLLENVTTAILHFPKPLVAALNGSAVAGGCVIASAADERLMSTGRISVTELYAGVPLPDAAYRALVKAMGAQWARRLVFTGRQWSLDEALQAGYLEAIVDADELESVAVHRGRDLADRIPSRVFAFAKQQALRHETPPTMHSRGLEPGEPTRLWIEALESGWTSRYLSGVTEGQSTEEG